MVNGWADEEALNLASPWVCQEIREGFVDDGNWATLAFWDKEEGVEGTESGGDAGYP